MSEQLGPTPTPAIPEELKDDAATEILWNVGFSTNGIAAKKERADQQWVNALNDAGAVLRMLQKRNLLHLPPSPPNPQDAVAREEPHEMPRRVPYPGTDGAPTDDPHDMSHMVQITELIADMQSILDRFGNTCVYIRRGGLGWGALALNRRADDEKFGLFDLQAEHDRDLTMRHEQAERLIAQKNAALSVAQRARDEGSRLAWDKVKSQLLFMRDEFSTLPQASTIDDIVFILDSYLATLPSPPIKQEGSGE